MEEAADMIVLPAIKDDRSSPSPRQKAAAKTGKKKRPPIKQKPASGDRPKNGGPTGKSPKEKNRGRTNGSQDLNPAFSAHILPAEDSGRFLPEYNSRTNGLRELLSTIDPPDRAYHCPENPADPSLNEIAMHIPHSRPGIPASHDLPVGPARWGLYLSGGFGAMVAVALLALAYSHFSSPVGFDWDRLQNASGTAYHRLIAALAGKEYVNEEKVHLARLVRPDTRPAGSENLETVVTTASRISTTAAMPTGKATGKNHLEKRPHSAPAPVPSDNMRHAGSKTIETPSIEDIFLTPEELEKQVRALEENGNGKIAALPPLPVRNGIRKKHFSTKQQPEEYQQLVVIPAANIDPDMENQIFKRARSYLKQRDISSARMILQYAASLGSGISAMALAETFDPNYLKKVNLHDIAGSPRDARKWYDMAARLGIKEARRRLALLK